MAKVRSPLLSIGASGQIGKSFVLASWRGVNYARQLVTPSNPQTTAQTSTRNTFSGLSSTWKILPSAARAPWDAATKGRPLTNRNQFVKTNLPSMRGEADMLKFSGSPGALGGIPPTSLAASTGAASGEVDVLVGAPEEPTGWTLDKIVSLAFVDRDPATIPDDTPVVVEDSDPTPGADSSANFTGLDPGETYVVTSWSEWTRPDGRTAYGSALTDSAEAGA